MPISFLFIMLPVNLKRTSEDMIILRPTVAVKLSRIIQFYARKSMCGAEIQMLVGDSNHPIPLIDRVK